MIIASLFWQDRLRQQGLGFKLSPSQFTSVLSFPVQYAVIAEMVYKAAAYSETVG